MKTLLLLLAVASGCAPAIAMPPTRSATVAHTAAGDVDVTLQTPARVVWTASSLRSARPAMQVIVTNRSSEIIDVSDARIHLEAVREGTTFRCGESAGPEPGAREPSSLVPGASYTFDRVVDCPLPLTGRYSVRVSLSFGRGDWQRPRAIRTFELAVTAPNRDEPRPTGLAPGLWAALGASRSIGGESNSGQGKVAVLLVNAGAAPIPMPLLRLALRVYRTGTSIPCEDEPIALKAPPVLGPGESHREALAVSCLGLHAPGRYDVVGRLVAGSDEVEVGRLRIEISNDPSLLAPSTTSRPWR